MPFKPTDENYFYPRESRRRTKAAKREYCVSNMK
jgi:hypothetical protein